MSMEKKTIQVSRSEALVLFEFLSRYRENERLDIVDQSEERVLWDILADLETKLTEPFKSDYQELLEKARNEIRDEEF